MRLVHVGTRDTVACHMIKKNTDTAEARDTHIIPKMDDAFSSMWRYLPGECSST